MDLLYFVFFLVRVTVSTTLKIHPPLLYLPWRAAPPPMSASPLFITAALAASYRRNVLPRATLPTTQPPSFLYYIFQT